MSAEDLEAARRELIAASAMLDRIEIGMTGVDILRAVQERQSIAQAFLDINVFDPALVDGERAEESIPYPSQGQVSQPVSDGIDCLIPVKGMERKVCGRTEPHTPHIWHDRLAGSTSLTKWCNGTGEFPRLDATDRPD